jgi:RND family efflux transporter MFP subunit
MRKTLVLISVVALGLGGVTACNKGDAASATAPAAGGAGGGARGAGRGVRPPMPVEMAVAERAPLAEQIQIVGNLIGAATVQVVPRVNGRLQSVAVQLGDSVRRGQTIAKVEDFEIQEQVRQAEAAFRVAQATIRQRDADLKLATTNRDRSKSLFDRQLLPQQTYDDTENRYEAAQAQTDFARAQFEQTKARLDELNITLANTVIASPVDGFVSKRFLDPGAFVGPNSPVAAVVDIRTVRMVANLIEKDTKRVPAGTSAAVEVDAFPGEKFKGRVSRVAPVFDPATRTAEMEIEIPNSGYRLKPGMYARVLLTVGSKENALTVPRTAVIEVNGQPGVFVAAPVPAGDGPVQASGAPPLLQAKFLPVATGIRDGERVEITSGVEDGARVVTTGAGALKDGDRIAAAGEGRGREGRGARGAREGTGQRQGSDR